MDLIKTYNLRRSFLEKIKPDYDNSSLTDLLRWFGKVDCFNAGMIRKEWDLYIASRKSKRASFNFYLHIPFCRSKCRYCSYYSKKLEGSELEEYIEAIKKQIFYFRKIFQKIKFNNLYIGGGTPSMLSEDQISELLESLFSSFSFSEKGEKTFESNPDSITERKLGVLRQLGFNRVSLGVQSINKKILTQERRGYQNTNKIKKIVKFAKSLEFEVNVDLLAGLRGDTAKSMLDSFLKIVRMKPDSIMVYRFRPPQGYIKSDSEKISVMQKDIRNNFLKIKKPLETLAFEQGYEMPKSKTIIYDSAGYKFLLKKKGALVRSYDFSASVTNPQAIFALGKKANAYIPGSMQYYCEFKEGQSGFSFDSSHAMFKGIKLSKKDEMRSFMLHKLSQELCFSQNVFKKMFGVEFKKVFGREFNFLNKISKLKIKGDLVYLPPEPLERFAACTFFFERKSLEMFARERQLGQNAGSSEGKTIPPKNFHKRNR